MYISNFLQFLRYFGKGYELKFVFIILMSVFAGFLEFIGIALIFPLILMILQPDAFSYFGVFGNLLQFHSPELNIICLSLFVFGAFLLKNIFMCFVTYCQMLFLKDWQANINTNVFKMYLFSSYESKLSMPENFSIFQFTQLSDIVFKGFVLRWVVVCSSSVILAVILLFLVYKFNWWAIITGVFFLVTGIIQNKILKSLTVSLGDKKISLMNAYNRNILAALKNIKDIKIFGKEKYFYNAYKNYSLKTAKVDTLFDFYSAISANIVEIVIIVAVLIMSFGVIKLSGGNSDMMVASFAVLAATIFRMAPIVNKIQTALNVIGTHCSVFKEFISAYEYYLSIPVEDGSKNDDMFEFEDEIVIKKLGFSFPNKEVLKDINLSIKKGEFIGIVGTSGVGKTTFIDILMGLLNSYTGCIEVDKKRLNSALFSSWYNSIAYVPQNVTTLPISISENIAFGIDKNDIDYERLHKVIKTAQLDEYILQLPDGVETVLNDVQSLSQGQKQRIGIARALYKNHSVLFLDEITSALDIETENKIIACLNELKGKKTIIAIAHRLSTLKNCDKLFYFKSKDCVICGTFAELIDMDKDFEHLVQLAAVENKIS